MTIWNYALIKHQTNIQILKWLKQHVQGAILELTIQNFQALHVVSFLQSKLNSISTSKVQILWEQQNFLYRLESFAYILQAWQLHNLKLLANIAVHINKLSSNLLINHYWQLCLWKRLQILCRWIIWWERRVCLWWHFAL